MKKYKVESCLYPNGEWIMEEEWKAMIIQEYEQIMKYQEMSRYGLDTDGNECYMSIEIKPQLEQQEEAPKK